MLGDDGLADWYAENSLVWCNNDHAVWSQKKVRKKFGRVEKAKGPLLGDILKEKRDKVRAWIEEKLEAAKEKEGGK